jgi:hypothetical protein
MGASREWFIHSFGGDEVAIASRWYPHHFLRDGLTLLDFDADCRELLTSHLPDVVGGDEEFVGLHDCGLFLSEAILTM